MLLGGHSELVEEGLGPDLLRVVPVGDDPVLEGRHEVRIPRLDWASSPTKESFCPIPTVTPVWRGVRRSRERLLGGLVSGVEPGQKDPRCFIAGSCQENRSPSRTT